MRTAEPHSGTSRGIKRRTGPRHWFRITGLPGWKRVQLGMSAFGDARCCPHPKAGVWRRTLGLLKRRFAGWTRALAAATPPSDQQSLPTSATKQTKSTDENCHSG